MHRLLFVLMLTVAIGSAGPIAAQGITGPEQPRSGPGGRAYLHDEVVGEHYGEQPTGYWLYEPVAQPSAQGSLPPLPIVILLHGYSATDPTYLKDWIDHIVRRGRVVIFPDYQTDDPLAVPPLEYTGNMIDGVTAALDELRTGGHVQTTLAGLAVAGYSMGGVLALNYAAMAESLNLPSPSVVLALTPGGCSNCDGPGDDSFGVPYRDLLRIEPDSKLMLVVGEDDDFVGAQPAEIAWEQTGQIPDENRDFLVVRTDDHGDPPLVADHSFPSNAGASAEVDALDWYGSFKWLDGLILCVEQPETCEEMMNGGAVQLDMGEWSDGAPVVQPLLVEAP